MNDQRGDSMSKKLWMPVVVAAGVALSAASLDVAAQSKQGYWTQPAGGDARVYSVFPYDDGTPGENDFRLGYFKEYGLRIQPRE